VRGWSVTGPELRLATRTLHPDLPGLAFLGQFALQGPYLPLLELQARWITTPPGPGGSSNPTRRPAGSPAAQPPPAVDSHNLRAVALAEAAGVGPDRAATPSSPTRCASGRSRRRVTGSGTRPALPAAADRFFAQRATSVRARVDQDDVAMLATLMAPGEPVTG
jgi:dimethylaniline monooxygenase (N-oxide forming)